MKTQVYNKLVRDKIPEILGRRGIQTVTHIATNEEYRVKLLEKLLEEALECFKKPGVEELADLREVIDRIAELLGVELGDLEKIQRTKAAERGGFKERIILEKTIEGGETGGKV